MIFSSFSPHILIQHSHRISVQLVPNKGIVKLLYIRVIELFDQVWHGKMQQKVTYSFGKSQWMKSPNHNLHFETVVLSSIEISFDHNHCIEFLHSSQPQYRVSPLQSGRSKRMKSEFDGSFVSCGLEQFFLFQPSCCFSQMFRLNGSCLAPALHHVQC